MDGSFVQNVNYVAELDNRYARIATLSKSNLSLVVGTTYAIDTTYKVYSKTTNMSTTVTVPSANITSATIAAYLAGLEISIETAYPAIAVAQSYTSQIDGNGFNIGTMSAVLNVSGTDLYVMDLNIKIALLGVTKYDISATLTNTMQILPTLGGLTSDVIAAAIVVSDISPSVLAVALIDNYVTTVALNNANVTTVGTNIASVNTVAAGIANVNSIVATVIPNMAEILLADNNAVIATTKAAEALASQQAAASLLDQFDDRYLGNKAIEPLLDNDGLALLAGALYFDTVANKMRVYGSDLAWSDALILTTGSISTMTNKTIDSITNQVGADHIHYKVRNNTAAIIPRNTVVTASGTQPGTDYINVIPVTDPQAQIALGIVHTELAVNGSGLVVNTGVIDDINTSAFAVGTILYPSATGGFTITKPISGRYQACAVVLRTHAIQGTLLCEFTNPEYISSTTQEGYVQLNNTLTSTSTVQALTAAQGKALADGKQPLDTTLTALAGIVTAADTVVYATGVDTFGTSGLTTFGRSLIDDIDASASRTTLGVVIGTDVQAYDTGLQSISGLITSADQMIYTTASDTYAVASITAAGRALIDDADAATMRTTLGAESSANKGVANGYAPLGADLKVPAANLPAYVDDVLEYANLAALPATGVAGIIYITIATNRSYRWSGTAYVDITGMVDSVNGYTGAVVLTKSDVALGSVDNTSDANKPVSIAQATAIGLKADQSTTYTKTEVDTSTTLMHKDSATGAAAMPYGTTAQRPAVPTVGYMRFNTDLGKAEVWNGTLWAGVGGGASGGGSDTVFVETSYNVTSNYTITAGKSAFTVGDYLGNVYLADGISITTPDNSNWVIQGN